MQDEPASRVLRECRRLLSANGTLRITCPDAESIIAAYRGDGRNFLDEMMDTEAKYFGEQFPDNPELGSRHVTFLGMLSNYIQNNKHVPVIARKETIDKKMDSLSTDDFCRWAVSLQTPDQLKTGGHVNGWHPAKLSRFLQQAGFERVSIKEPRSSEVGNFRRLEHSDERNGYSLFVEAQP